MSFNPEERTLYELLNDKCYSVPKNQRKFVWDKEKWQELLEDIDLVVNKKVNSHFVGSIILHEDISQNGIQKQLSIIDGQQRIITATVMLSTIAYLFAEYNDFDTFRAILVKNLLVLNNRNKAFPIVSKDANNSVARFVLNILQAENNLQINLPIPPLEHLIDFNTETKVKECILFYYNAIKERINGDVTTLDHYRSALFETKYIDILAKNNEDAYMVFEVLNARGQALLDFDLLRNYLIRNVTDEHKEQVKKTLDQIEQDLESFTEIFLKHYVMHKYGCKTNKDEQRPYKVIVKNEKGKDKLSLLQDLQLKAYYYKKIVKLSNCTAEELKIFQFFKPRRQQLFRPLILGLMHQHDLKAINTDTYNDSLRFLYEFFVCYTLIGEQYSNKIEDIVEGYASKLENNFSLKVLIDMRNSMKARLPEEKVFKTNIKNLRYSHKWKPYSGSKKEGDVRAVFEVLERERGFNGDIDGMFTIEHIYPDSENIENAHIGNLMLLELGNNIMGSNLPPDKKIDRYSSSALTEPQQIAKILEKQALNFEQRAETIAVELLNYIKQPFDIKE